MWSETTGRLITLSSINTLITYKHKIRNIVTIYKRQCSFVTYTVYTQ